MKLLIYCNKGTPLFRTCGDCDNGDCATYYDEYVCDKNFGDYGKGYESIMKEDLLNGKISVECDYEVEEIERMFCTSVCFSKRRKEILKKSCSDIWQMNDYLNGKKGYAIHIKNLQIFNEPYLLSDFASTKYFMIGNTHIPLKPKAPKPMCYVYDANGEKKILMSVSPEVMCRILNGNQDVIVSKKVLRGML